MLFVQIDIYPRETYILIIDLSGIKYKFEYFDYDFKQLKQLQGWLIHYTSNIQKQVTAKLIMEILTP